MVIKLFVQLDRWVGRHHRPWRAEAHHGFARVDQAVEDATQVVGASMAGCIGYYFGHPQKFVSHRLDGAQVEITRQFVKEIGDAFGAAFAA